MQLGALIVVVAIATFFVMGRSGAISFESFTLNKRNIGWFAGSFTILANWFQAPAILLSGLQAYRGIGAFLLFWVPNVIGLSLPALVIDKIRARVPEGFNIPEFVGAVFGVGPKYLYVLASFGALVGVMTLTLVGLSQWLAPLGYEPFEIALGLTAISYFWVVPKGNVNAVTADMVKVAFIGILAILAVSLTALHWGDRIPDLPYRALRWTPENTTFAGLMWTDGVAFAASLLAGPFINTDLGERAYMGVHRSNYLAASILFALGVVACGTAGLLAWHLGVTPEKGVLPFYAVLEKFMPSMRYYVAVALLLVLTAAFASMFASASNLLTTTIVRPLAPKTSEAALIRWGRTLMIVPVGIAAFVVSLDKQALDLGLVLQGLAVIRGEALVPVLAAAFFPWVHRRSVFWGMLLAFIGGISLMFGAPIWHALTGETLSFLSVHGKPLGALWAVFMPAVAIYVSLYISPLPEALSAKN